MLEIDVNNYRRDNDKNKHDKAMHYASSDTDTSSTSSLISSSSSLFSFDDSHPKNTTAHRNNSNSFINQVEATSDIKTFHKSALNIKKSGFIPKDIDSKENNEKTFKNSISDNEKKCNLDNKTLNSDKTVPSISDSIFKDTSEQQYRISESLFESNLENLSHDTFDTDLQKRKLRGGDFVFCDMTSTNDLNFISHSPKDSKSHENGNELMNKDESFPPSMSELNQDDETNEEDSNFSFAEDVENFDKLLMQSPQIIKSRKRVDDMKAELMDEGGAERMRNLNKKGHNVNFAERLVTVYSCVLDPWKDVAKCSLADLIASYTATCSLNSTQPSPTILTQLQEIHDATKKLDVFSLKDMTLSLGEVSSLEEVFKRLRIGTLVMQAVVLDEQAAVVLFDLLSYYEPCDRLVISANKDMAVRGWQALSQYLKETSSLYSLEAKDLGIPEYSFGAFLKGIQSCANLSVLSLENSISSGRHLDLLINAIRGSQSITNVTLAGNQLTSSDACLLSNLARHHKPLQYLDISNNNIMDQGATLIFDVLSTNPPSLSHLSLANNQISKFSLSVLSRSLKQTKTLHTLLLDHNHLCNGGLGKLKEGLSSNHCLVHLGLQSVGVSCEGIASLSEFIAIHPKLRRLNLLGNQIGVKGLTSLCRSVKLNHVITCIDLDKPELIGHLESSQSNNNDVLKTGGGKSDEWMEGWRMHELVTEIEGYIGRNKEEEVRARNEAALRKRLDKQSASDNEMDQSEHNNYDSLPPYSNISRARPSHKPSNNLPFLLSLSLSSLSSSASSLSASSSSSSLSASMSSLSASSTPPSTAVSCHSGGKQDEVPNMDHNNINNQFNNISGKQINNQFNNISGKQINKVNSAKDEGLPSYEEAIKQLNSKATSIIPLITVNGVHQNMLSTTTPATSTPSTATPSTTTPSTATPATSTPSTTTPATSTPSTSTPATSTTATTPSTTTQPASSPATSTATSTPISLRLATASLPASPTTPPTPNRAAEALVNGVDVRVVSSPKSKKKFRVSRTSALSPIRLPPRPSSLLSPTSLLSSPSSLSSSPSSSTSPPLSALSSSL